MTAPTPPAATQTPDLAGSDLTTGSDLVVPDLAGLELADPDVAGSDVAGPDLAGPDVAGPDLAGSDLADPDLAGLRPAEAGPELGDRVGNAGCGASAILARGGPAAVPFDLCCVLTLVRAGGTDPGPAVCRALAMLDVDPPLVAESAP